MTKTGDPNFRWINVGTRILRALRQIPWRGTFIQRTHVVGLPGSSDTPPPSPPAVPEVIEP